ncbi:hypothetical protein D3C85_1040710 [compost metagenome]
MAAGFGTDGRKRFHAGAVALHMLTPGATKGTQCTRQVDITGEAFHDMDHAGPSLRTIIPMGLERTGLHLLEAQRQHALGLAALNGGARQVQCGGASRAVVVDVDDRDAGTAHFIQRGLAAGGIAIYIAGESHLYLVVTDAGILECQAYGLGAHVGVARACARLGEGDHTDPCNDDFFAHRLCSFEMHVRFGGPAGRPVFVGTHPRIGNGGYTTVEGMKLWINRSAFEGTSRGSSPQAHARAAPAPPSSRTSPGTAIRTTLRILRSIIRSALAANPGQPIGWGIGRNQRPGPLRRAFPVPSSNRGFK